MDQYLQTERNRVIQNCPHMGLLYRDILYIYIYTVYRRGRSFWQRLELDRIDRFAFTHSPHSACVVGNAYASSLVSGAERKLSIKLQIRPHTYACAGDRPCFTFWRLINKKTRIERWCSIVSIKNISMRWICGAHEAVLLESLHIFVYIGLRFVFLLPVRHDAGLSKLE